MGIRSCYKEEEEDYSKPKRRRVGANFWRPILRKTHSCKTARRNQRVQAFLVELFVFFYFFSDPGEVVTLEIPPRTLVAVPMKLLNGPYKHGAL